MKYYIFILSAFVVSSVYATSASYKNMTIQIPNKWVMKSSVIYDGYGVKVGELISKKSWSYSSGPEFVKSFKKGFFDDPESTKFILNGSNDGLFWVCRSGIYEDGKGGAGIWYSRIFWVKGPIVKFYSSTSCEEKLQEVIGIAKTLKEK